MSKTALSLDHVDKLYATRGRRAVHAVRDVSLAVEEGQIVALLGSSGCGKTSTLRMVAGFEAVSGGRIGLAGREIHGLPPAKRGVAMAFEGYSLYPPLTVRQNITFALEAASLPKSEIDRRLGEIVDLLELQSFLDRYPSSISGGQQQRASLGRALIRKADLYLLDEPMGQLEPQLRAMLRGRLKHFLKERGLTTILVTHDQTEANALADRIAVMEDGELQQFASPAMLKDRPANLFVGTFIGEPPMNVIEARARRRDTRLVFDLPGGVELVFRTETMPASIVERALAASNVTVGIRPYALRLSDKGLVARVVSNQWLGDQTHIAAECAQQLVVAVEHERVKAPIGSEIRLAVAATDLHLFETATGKAIAHGGERMTGDLIIGVDAGTSVIKAVAFALDGRQLAVVGRPNSYTTMADGGVEQDPIRTWADTAAVLRGLQDHVPDLARRVMALAVTGQGDGTWLIDAAGEPVGHGLLWLDSRARDLARDVVARPDYARIYETTGTGVSPCQQHLQLAWMQKHQPERIARATTAFHCKDWLYLNLTGERVTDPTEGTFTFGDYRTCRYAPELLEAFGIAHLGGLLPPMCDGTQRAHGLTASAAAATGLSAGLPVVLGFVDIICSALGGGLLDRQASSGCTVLGSTGMHMRLVSGPDEVRLNSARSGYTMPFPAGNRRAQMQSNMAATLNIDWVLDMGRELLASQGLVKSRGDLLAGLDERLERAPPGSAIFHPYISTAGERGPFMDPLARAAFTGLDHGVGYFGLMRTVLEGLALASRDCYEVMGGPPRSVRLAGGAARSKVMRGILAAALNARIQVIAREETGAAGAAMMAAVQIGAYPDMLDCAAVWVDPHLGPAEAPDPALVAHYARLYPIYRQAREHMPPLWQALARTEASA